MSADLKPALEPRPFCGGARGAPVPSSSLLGTALDLEMATDQWDHQVRCWCGAAGPNHPTQDQAIAAWNSRAGRMDREAVARVIDDNKLLPWTVDRALQMADQIISLSPSPDSVGPAADALDPVAWRPTHRHVKRDTDYEVIGEGLLQTAVSPGAWDDLPTTIYRGEDGRLWARPTIEFNDGRFIALSSGSPPLILREDGSSRSQPVLASNGQSKAGGSGGWQTIETAPRDGTRLLTYDVRKSRDGAINVCWWAVYFRDEEGWLDDHDSEPDPTHWMPLPLPPSIPTGEEGETS